MHEIGTVRASLVLRELRHTRDTVEESLCPAEIPWAATLRGREQVAGWFARVSEAAEFEQFALQEICAQGGTVMTLVHERFRIKATGCTVDNNLAQVFKLRGGKVVSFREYYDTAAVAAAFRNA
jgi:ketosteroid isomerase-like protein